MADGAASQPTPDVDPDPLCPSLAIIFLSFLLCDPPKEVGLEGQPQVRAIRQRRMLRFDLSRRQSVSWSVEPQPTAVITGLLQRSNLQPDPTSSLRPLRHKFPKQPTRRREHPWDGRRGSASDPPPSQTRHSPVSPRPRPVCPPALLSHPRGGFQPSS